MWYRGDGSPATDLKTRTGAPCVLYVVLSTLARTFLRKIMIKMSAWIRVNTFFIFFIFRQNRLAVSNQLIIAVTAGSIRFLHRPMPSLTAAGLEAAHC